MMARHFETAGRGSRCEETVIERVDGYDQGKEGDRK